MTVSLLAISSFFYIRKADVRLGLVTSFSVAIFTFFYSLGAGPIPFTLSAEVFPLALRGRCCILPQGTQVLTPQQRWA